MSAFAHEARIDERLQIALQRAAGNIWKQLLAFRDRKLVSLEEGSNEARLTGIQLLARSNDIGADSGADGTRILS
jgi:hypothetical protein